MRHPGRAKPRGHNADAGRAEPRDLLESCRRALYDLKVEWGESCCASISLSTEEILVARIERTCGSRLAACELAVRVSCNGGGRAGMRFAVLVFINGLTGI